MSGIPQWNKNVSVTAAPGKRIRLIDASFATAILNGGTKLVDIFAAPGYVSKVKALRLVYPPIVASTTGNTTISILISGGLISISSASVTFNTSLTYNNGLWVQPTTSVDPGDLTAQALIPQSLSFDETQSVQFQFKNVTNVTDGGINKRIWLLVEEEKIQM